MKELRIGLVLYGGVSLAVYINGVLTELLHLLRASKERQSKKGGGLNDTDPAKIYADLLDELECQTKDDLRVIVDTISGSSAGGINGVILARAIVDGGEYSVLKNMWLKDADISKLKVETVGKLLRFCFFLAGVFLKISCLKKWFSEKIPCLSLKWLLSRIYVMIAKPKGEPELTLLKGDYFTCMIAQAFEKMGSGEPLLTRRGSFDLYITQTDVYGWPRHLPVSKYLHDGPLYERSHAHVMHFRRKPRGGKLNDDFGLTYAARSTGSFPVVFSPINYKSISRVYKEERPEESVPTMEEFARDHLPEHRLSPLSAFSANCVWMMDGGVFDNKPFSYVMRAIERKAAEHEVHRAIVYVEPNPEGEIGLKACEHVPAPLQIGDRLYDLLLHEPIYEDLRRLQDRNAKVRKIRAFLNAPKDSAWRAAMKAGELKGLPREPNPADADKWRKATNCFAAKASLSGYPGYVVLKARSSVHLLANVICRALDYPRDSRQAFFIRQIMYAWFERKGVLSGPVHCENEGGYVLKEGQRSLLRDFDVPFRLRRLRALVRATNEKYDALNRLGSGSKIERKYLDEFKSSLEKITFEFQSLEEDDLELKKVILDSFDGQDMRSDIDGAVKSNCFKTHCFINKYEKRIEKLCEGLSQRFQCVSDKQEREVVKALQGLPNGFDGKVSHDILEAFVTFPFVDLITFPMMDSAGVEDLIEVKDIMRISPLDVPRHGKPPLKSSGLGSFKGFFCRDARKHDMKWGRIDGAHRLVDLIMEAVDTNKRLGSTKVQGIRCQYLKRLASAIEDDFQT